MPQNAGGGDCKTQNMQNNTKKTLRACLSILCVLSVLQSHPGHFLANLRSICLVKLKTITCVIKTTLKITLALLPGLHKGNMGKIISLGLKSFWPIFSGHQSDSASWTWKKKDSKFWKKKAGRPKDFSGFSFLAKINDCLFIESVQEVDHFPRSLSFAFSCSIKRFYVRTLCLGLHFSGN